MNCICTIHTDYVDPSKTEEILKNCTQIITEALRRANVSEKKQEEQKTKKGA